MKKYILLLASLVLAGTMMARQLTPDEALALAMGKLKAAQPERTRAMATGVNVASVRLTHTETTSQNVPLYYVYNIAEGGFIIASADDRASSLLGYTDSGDFDGAKQNQSFMAWLKDCRKALSYIGSMPETTRSTSAETRALDTSVSPLLGEIRWNQNEPYNLLTPLRVDYSNDKADPDTVHAPTGCVATAVAQVMKYYEWPVTGTGSHTNLNDIEQTIDFSQSTYQWSKMLPAYEGGESEESQLAVAQLMNDVGCALDMEYGYDRSGAFYDEALRALANYFGYDKNMRLKYRSECSSEEWNDLLQTELNEQRPLIFNAGASSGGVHEFIVDGYDVNGLYHVNWGWGGRANGYFDINLMAPDFQGIGGYAGGYTIGQSVIMGVRPDVEGTSVAKPELVMTRHFEFNEEVKQWTYIVSNNSLGDFTGEVGVAMESPAGEITKVMIEKHNDEPIVFTHPIKYSFDIPAVLGPGYKLYPYFCDKVGGEIKHISTYYNAICALYSIEEDGKYSWTPDVKDVADCKIVNVEVKHNFVGFDPQINLIVNNSAASAKEYAEDIYIDITTMVDGEEKKVCKGMAQIFIKPGETKEVAVKCNIVEEEFKGKIVEGEYKYHVYFGTGGNYYHKCSDSFEMVITLPSEITYSDFSVNKTELLPGEELTASITVTNTGGYDIRNLIFLILRLSDRATSIIELGDVDIEPNSKETFTFNKVLPYTPDEYLGSFFVDLMQLAEAPSFEIAVVDPTNLDKITSAPASNGKSAIYDLQGRPVKQLHKGKLYIGKDKFMLK